MRYIFALLAALIFVSTSSTLDAQVRVRFNIDTQPAWGPTGHDYVENYYMPDIEAYYNVPSHRYYYNERGRWISNSSLPARYGQFDLYTAHKEVVNERNPWRNHKSYRDKYSSYKGAHDQEPIRDSKDSKYFVNRNHPQHDTWVRDHNRGDNQDHNRGGNEDHNHRPQ